MRQLCRLCLEETKDNGYVPIFEPALLEQIFTFTSVQLKCTNGLFEKLCQKCYGHISKSNKFRNRVKEANEWFLRIVEWQKHNIDYSSIPTETIIRILRNQPEDDPLIDPILIKSQQLPVTAATSIIPTLQIVIQSAGLNEKPPSKKDVATSTIQIPTCDIGTSPIKIPTRDVGLPVQGSYFNKKTIGVSTDPRWLTRSIGTSTDSYISRLMLRNVGVGTEPNERCIHKGIGTSDYNTPWKTGYRSVGVSTEPSERCIHKGIGTSDYIAPLKTGYRSVAVGTESRERKKTRDQMIGTRDYDAPLKPGCRSIGVATSDWYWFHPKLVDTGTTTDNFQSGLAVRVMDNWTSMEGFVSDDDEETFSTEEESEEEEEEANEEELLAEGNEEVEIDEQVLAEFVKKLTAELDGNIPLVFEQENLASQPPSEALIDPMVVEEHPETASEQITCAFCSKICDSFATWRSHCQTMHDDLFRPFECSTCGADFKMKQHLDYHNNVVHLQLQHFECDLCGKVFYRKHELRTHAMMHLGERRYRCNVCPAKFSIKAGLNRHLALHKNVENEEAKKLKSPLQLQAWEQSYMCLYCGKHFATSEARNCHEKNHSKTAINIDSIFNFNWLDILDDDQMSNL